MKQISVIICSRNNEKYLDECLSSINYKLADVIFIDDCSTDNTKEIVSKFDTKYFRFGANLGLGICRNIGLEIYKKNPTKYCMFLDSDDYFEKYAMEQLIEEIQDHSLVVFQSETFGEFKRNYGKLKLFGSYELTKEISQQTPVVAWNKIYTFDSVVKSSFSTAIPDDNPFWFLYCCYNYGTKVKYIKNICHHYRQLYSSSYCQQNKGHNIFYDAIISFFYTYYQIVNNNLPTKEKQFFIDWLFGSYFENFVNHYKNIVNCSNEKAFDYVLSFFKKFNITTDNEFLGKISKEIIKAFFEKNHFTKLSKSAIIK